MSKKTRSYNLTKPRAKTPTKYLSKADREQGKMSKAYEDYMWEMYNSRYDALSSKNKMKDRGTKSEFVTELRKIERLNPKAEGLTDRERDRFSTLKHNAVRELANKKRMTSARQEKAFEAVRQDIISKEAKKLSGFDEESARENIISRAEKRGESLTEEIINKRVKAAERREIKKVIDKLPQITSSEGAASIAKDALSMSREQFFERLQTDKEFKRAFAKYASVETEYQNKRGEIVKHRSLTPVLRDLGLSPDDKR